ncbi:MAG: RluA family pseudouridine synthase [Magnetococcales bacterium]|nr:RluA family pseudouridine synthase [Magnetococcales bacterium]
MVEPGELSLEDSEVVAGEEADAVPARERQAVIPDWLAGERLDKALASLFGDGMSRATVQRLMRAGEVTSGERRLDSPDAKAVAGVRITLREPAPEPLVALPEAIPLVILYEDADLLVIDKPAGLVVHPGAGVPGGTLVNALLHHCREGAPGGGLSGIGGRLRPGIVHRLDKGTSGLLVAAKSDRAHLGLSAQFAAHTVERSYLALVRGDPGGSGTVDAPIGRDPHQRQRMAVVERGGRRAVTHYRLLKPLSGLALIGCRLETGRTHQIRVHLASIGHPLLGDPLYARPYSPPGWWPEGSREVVRRFCRQALHAGSLGFIHPVSGAWLRFLAPPPADFAGLLAALEAVPAPPVAGGGRGYRS